MLELTILETVEIKDESENSLIPTAAYISPNAQLNQSEAQAAASSSSGNILTYIMIAIFVFNLIIGTVYEDSFRYFWNLTHLLQILRIVILINIQIPEIIR